MVPKLQLFMHSEFSIYHIKLFNRVRILEQPVFKGYERVSNYAKRGVSMVASSLLDTAIKGGGSVLNQLR